MAAWSYSYSTMENYVIINININRYIKYRFCIEYLLEEAMKKIFKYVGVVLISVVAIIIVFIIISYVNHEVNLSRENKLYVPNGQIVEVNGHSMKDIPENNEIFDLIDHLQ